ncbi:MAG: 3-ketoacyl-ACP reductase [Candidatus Marinimicrobia bacterium]|nr:3-ketoacyl-ACP reductase [Candidatus Neomarinimicrobiota bacterium]
MKKVALVTGGSRGIGFGVAKQLAEAGFDLAINGVRDESSITEAKTQLENLGAGVLYCQGDVSDEEQRRSIIDKVRETYGRLHVLVNNAGVAPKERLDILEATEESYDRVMKINLQGPYFLTQSVANWMVKQKQSQDDYWGCIIFITSISSTVASPSRGEYCLSKAGLSMATKLYAVRLGEYDIPVYEVRPGIIKTDMTAPVTEKYDKLIEEGLMLQKRWGYPEDIGKAVASLAQEDLPYSTGQVLMVEGGMTVQRL